MALRDMGRFIRRFADSVHGMTEGFDKVFGPMPEPDANVQRTGRKSARKPRQKREPLFRGGGPKTLFKRKKKREERLF